MRLADGVLLVVDAVEGVMLVTEKAIKQACQEGLPICLLISKVDRLITELKVPPTDAYFKLRHTIDEVNSLIQLHSGNNAAFQVSQYAVLCCHAQPWAAQYDTWLLIKLTPKGIVFPSLSVPFLSFPLISSPFLSFLSFPFLSFPRHAQACDAPCAEQAFSAPCT